MITPEHCRSARAWLNWDQEELAKRANVSLSTVRDFEKERRTPFGNNLAAIEKAFADVGMLTVSDGGEPAGLQYTPRIRERDTYRPMLELLDDAPDGFLTTTDLIKGLEFRLEPVGEDNAILDSRSDTRFSQIVRNVVSHKDSATNPIKLGWIDYDRKKRGLRITVEGRHELSRPVSGLKARA